MSANWETSQKRNRNAIKSAHTADTLPPTNHAAIFQVKLTIVTETFPPECLGRVSGPPLLVSNREWTRIDANPEGSEIDPF